MAQGGPYIDPRGIPDMPMGQPALEDPMGSDIGLAAAQSPAAPQQQAAPLSNETVDALSAPRSGGGPRLSMDGGGYAWGVGASDFNPNGFKPNESRSTQVGKYGGAPLFAATLGMPTGAVASALQRNAQKQDEIRKAVQQFDPMAGVEDVNAPEYRDSFQRGAMDDIHGYVASVNEQWGDQEGYRRMMTAGTPESKGLRERGSAWTTVARKMNQATSAADAIINNKDGELQITPELRKQAEELRYKLNERAGNQDPVELAKTMNVFTANVSLGKQVKDDGVVNLIKNAGSASKFYEQIKKGHVDERGNTLYDPRYRTLLGREKIDRSAVVESLTDYYYDSRPTKDLTKEQVHKYFEGIVPEMPEVQDVKMDERSLPSSSGASKAGNTGVGTTVRADYRPLDVVGGTRGTNGVFFTPFQTTGDKEHTVKEMTVSSSSGAVDTPIRDASLTYVPDRGWRISGRSLSDEGKKALSEITETGGGGGAFGESEDSSKKVDAIWNKYRVFKTVPASINSSIVAAYWGDPDPNAAAAKIAGMDPAEMESAMKTQEGRDMVAKKMGINTERKNAGSFSTDTPRPNTDEATIKAAYPDAWMDPTHGWVVKDPATGKVRKVKLN